MLQHLSFVRRYKHDDLNFTRGLEANIGLACDANTRSETRAAHSVRCQIAAARIAAKFEALVLANRDDIRRRTPSTSSWRLRSPRRSRYWSSAIWTHYLVRCLRKHHATKDK